MVDPVTVKASSRHGGEPRRTADCHLIHAPPSPFQGSASQAVADTHPRVSSSTGRAAVSKTAGCRFESYLTSHLWIVRKTRLAARQTTNRAIPDRKSAESGKREPT